MTSRSSFFNWMKEDRKRRTWTIVLFLCICFVFTIGFEMVIENTLKLFQNHSIGQKDLLVTIEALAGNDVVPYYLLLCGIGAMLYGFQSFAWLMSKQKVDLYHSLPITRKEGFLVRYVNGMLFFMIPLLLHTGLLAILIGARGFLTQNIVWNLISNLGLYLLAFLLMYHLVILAVMMTGNLLVSILAAGTFLFYPSILRLILSWYYHESFVTESYMADPFGWLQHFAPFEQIIYMFQLVTNGYRNHMIIVLVMIVVSFFLCLWLYQKRPSESAGKALAFKKTGSVIRVLIVSPCAMVSGVFFFALTGSNSTIWLYLGTIIGAVFVHGFMEVVFHFDIRAAFRKNLQLAGTLVVILGIVSVFHFDLMGYDSYLPKQSELKAISYEANFDENTHFYYQTDNPGEMIERAGRFIDQKQRIEASRTTNVEEMYRLLEAYMEQWKEGKEDPNYKEFSICYELTNGKKVYRNYQIGRTLLEEHFASVYENKETKKVLYPAMNLSEKGIERVTCRIPFEENTLEFTEAEMSELLSYYKKDIENETFAEYLDRRTLAYITVFYSEKGKDTLQHVELPVPDTYKNVEQYLKSKDIFITLPNEKYEIKEAKIYNYSSNSGETVMMDKDVAWRETEESLVLTKEQIADILPLIVGAEYTYYDSLSFKDYSCRVVLTLKNKKTGVESESEYYMDRKEIPESIK